jgi:hypothetical protein
MKGSHNLNPVPLSLMVWKHHFSIDQIEALINGILAERFSARFDAETRLKELRVGTGVKESGKRELLCEID